jgi:hypothetical protein
MGDGADFQPVILGGNLWLFLVGGSIVPIILVAITRATLILGGRSERCGPGLGDALEGRRAAVAVRIELQVRGLAVSRVSIRLGRQVRWAIVLIPGIPPFPWLIFVTIAVAGGSRHQGHGREGQGSCKDLHV